MNSREIVKSVKEQRTSEHHFISWWRKEEDFLDFDLIDRFLENLKGDEEIGGFELVSQARMWEQLKKICGDRICRSQQNDQEVIKWEHKGSCRICPYVPSSLMEIFDIETHDSFVDS